MRQCDLAIRVEGNTPEHPGRPVGIVVMAGHTIVAEVSIAKVRKIIAQLDAMPQGADDERFDPHHHGGD